MASVKDDLKSFRRSWVHHTGMQLATMTVLAATFSVVGFGLSFSLNLKHLLASWGDGVQLTVYLGEETTDERAKLLKSEIESLAEVKRAEYLPREVATENFKQQMASYAPDLLADADFSNPFPSSFRVSLKNGVATNDDVKRLESIAASIQTLKGVEDVSYGQSWVKNYSSFVTTLYASAGVLGVILLLGSLFVVGNSIRTSISARREEIEILELVGATASMIRRPFVVEGLLTGAMAALIAIGLNYSLHLWQKSVMSGSLVLARLVPTLSFLAPSFTLLFILAGSLMGGVGAWLTVRKINDGWSARQGLEG